ncbi:MAG: hypothetical protein EPO21_24515 [Chloroflexota bacterium]|nr:MAG: hypothetical protein EPO21_24515 [Chloroflexota bacterium]
MSNGKKRYRPPDLNRDHARPRTAPAPSDAAIECRLADLISPATYALADHYHRLGLRWRILTLPVMVALLVTMIWRHVPSVLTLVQMLSRESLLWTPPQRVSQQALSLRLRTLPAQLLGQLFQTLTPLLLTRATARTRPQPAVVERTLQRFPQIWILDATTLEALFRKVGLLRDEPGTVWGGKLLAILDLPSKLPLHLWLDENHVANEKSFLDARVRSVLTAGTLLLFDLGFYAFPFVTIQPRWLGLGGHR